jgi:hypothetical protein
MRHARTSLFSFLFCSAIACGGAAPARAQAPTPPAAAASTWLSSLPAYPAAREVCWQNVVLAPEPDHPFRELHWTMYSSADSLDAVRDFYAKSGHPLTSDELKNGDESLSVYAKGAAYPSCDVAPDASARTIFIVSSAPAPK